MGVEDIIYLVTGIEITNKPITSMAIGDKYNLTYKVNPENATNKNVSWTTTNDEIAYIEEGTNNLITVKEGTATITINTEDGNYTDSFDVIVDSKTITVQSITLNKDELELLINDTYKLIPTINPSEATNKEVIYSSNNPDIASVTEDGVVIAKLEGEALITVTTKSGNKKATCNVKVNGDHQKPQINKVEPKVNEKGEYLVYIDATDENGIKSVTVSGIDITTQKTEDGRYYFKPGENAEYIIEVTDNFDNKQTYSYTETGLTTKAVAAPEKDSNGKNIVKILTKTNYKVSKVTVEGKEIEVNAENGEYVFNPTKNGTYNIAVTYEDGTVEEYPYEETRLNENEGNSNNGDSIADNGNNNGSGNNIGNNGNNENKNNTANSNNNESKKVATTDTTIALKTMPKTGIEISATLAGIAGIIMAVIAWIKRK